MAIKILNNIFILPPDFFKITQYAIMLAMRILLLISFLILPGCQKEYNEETCTELSFRKFKGNPPASKDFDDNCKNVQIWYTQQLCQRALGKLIIHGEKNKLITEFGSKVMECFTEYDLTKFLKK